ncbi:MAG: thiolase family protein [Bernardetiaceae bacterium]|jgi:acetyl-CoA C-acetyltransferase|nr:thiolase family protein [Bernardetiaceae bacterium]
MKEVFIVSATRTPMGSFGGQLAGFTATQLGALAVKAAVERAQVEPGQIEEILMGNVIAAGLGQAPATQVAIYAGLGNRIPATTVNKVCASGMKTMMWAAQSIMAGQNDLLVAGGMESMSNIPYYLPKARFGYKYGNGELLDGLAFDGLVDRYQHTAMGVSADATARKYNISREAQDAFAVRSYQLAAQATASGALAAEMVAVEVPQKKGAPLLITEDEEYKNVVFDKIPNLKPAFTPDGTVTAANASTINDGAAATMIASGEAVKRLNLKPLARIVAFADAAQEPEWFTTAPTLAAPKALHRAGLAMSAMDLVEVNEAFAVVVLAFNQLLDVDPAKVNIHGGAVALGHPLGCSGTRIVGTLAHSLQRTGGRYGLAAICNGGGGASAIVIERV